MDFLQNHVESVVFCATEPVKAEEIRLVMSEMFEAEIQLEDIEAALESLLLKYEEDKYPFQVYRIAGGYQFLTKPAYQTSLGIFLKQKSKKRLSTSALEVMAIIAYKQPVTKHQIEDIRGVNCDYAVQKLLEKELIEIKGKSDGVGRPLIYGTSAKFMEYFGINSLAELPNPKDFAQLENTIGTELDPSLDEFAKFGLMEGVVENGNGSHEPSVEFAVDQEEAAMEQWADDQGEAGESEEQEEREELTDTAEDEPTNTEEQTDEQHEKGEE